jgi:ABC-type sugar transport systems, ATPase components
MQLALKAISKQVGDDVWLHEMDLTLKPAEMTVLLGATQAGKTSLMRIMAGLDAPSSGRVLVDDQDVTGWSVRKRNVAMVYQQFINYPSMTVRENIASPMKLRRESGVDARVEALAERLGIAHFLQRLPGELSGGQQQRVALARALAKGAPLMLLDEPLVNLDYKLRETLREELSELFSDGRSTVVYATTEPGEALLLGGHTAVLHEGKLLQYGPAVQVYDRPVSLDVARTFNDPPMNFVPGVRCDEGIRLPSGQVLQLAMPRDAQPSVTVGLRAASLKVEAVSPVYQGRPSPVQTLNATVLLAEISGSDTFLHVDTAAGPLVAQLTGVHHFELGDALPLYFHERDAFIFDALGRLLRAPNSGVTGIWRE